MNQKRAYKYGFYPTPDQAKILARTFGCVRYTYNWALRLRTDAYYQRQERVYYADLSAAFTELRHHPETEWLSDVAYIPCQQALRHLEKALCNFFEGRARYPKFKKKRGPQAAEYTTSAFTWNGTHLRLARMTEPLDIRWSRPLPERCKPTTITVTRDTAGRSFVSFLVEEDIQLLSVSSKTVGIDLGLHDVGWGELIRQLQYKAAWYGRTVVAIGTWYPSSKRCHACGYLLDELDLDVRQWTCPACGICHDRDTNAALNIKAAGQPCSPVESR